jgi:hypothetical protein
MDFHRADAQLRRLSSAVADAMEISESELEEYTDDDVSVLSDDVADKIEQDLATHRDSRLFPTARVFEAAIKARAEAQLSQAGVLMVSPEVAAPISAAVDELLVRVSLKQGVNSVLARDELDAVRYAASVEFDAPPGDATQVFRAHPDGRSSRLTTVRTGRLQPTEKELIRRLVGVTAYANLVSGAGIFSDRPSMYGEGVTGQTLAANFKKAANLLLDWELSK